MFKIKVLVISLIFTTNLYASDLLIVGDSLSTSFGIKTQQGWVALLNNKLENQGIKNYHITNASITGETALNGSRRIDKLLTLYKPAILIIELGGNDGLRGYDLKEIEANLALMIEKAKAVNAKVVLVQMRIPTSYGRKYSNSFSKIYSKLATKYNVGLTPFILTDIYGLPGMIQNDGIHPTAKAQPLILNNIWPELKKLF